MPISPAYPLPDEPVERRKLSDRLGLPPSVIAIVTGLSLFGFMTPNPLLTVVSIAILPFLLVLPWRVGEPPILPFILGYQWLQATMRVFHANIVGVKVEDLALYEMLAQFANVELAIWLSLLGLVFLAIGMRVALIGLPPLTRESLVEEASSFSIARAFWLFLAISVSTGALVEAVGYFSGFRQIVYALEYVKWAAYFLLAYLVIARSENYRYLAVGFAYEFITGIGFFSSFKEVIIVTVLAYFTARSKVTLSTATKGLAMFLAVAFLGAVWTVVKPDFRKTVGEVGSQGSQVSQEAQIAILYDLVMEMDGQALADGLEPLASRISYVDMFGYALTYVPNVVPHERGTLWATAIKHVLTPRLFFPNKPEIVHDSEVTNRYTGLYVSGVDDGTSISIGYMGESYIDFGPFWMYLPIFLVGLWRGLMYRYFVSRSLSHLVGFAFVVGLFTTWFELEKATGKLFGGLMMRFIVLSIIFALFVPSVLRWLRHDGDFDDEYDTRSSDETALATHQPTWT